MLSFLVITITLIAIPGSYVQAEKTDRDSNDSKPNAEKPNFGMASVLEDPSYFWPMTLKSYPSELIRKTFCPGALPAFGEMKCFGGHDACPRGFQCLALSMVQKIGACCFHGADEDETAHMRCPTDYVPAKNTYCSSNADCGEGSKCTVKNNRVPQSSGSDDESTEKKSDKKSEKPAVGLCCAKASEVSPIVLDQCPAGYNTTRNMPCGLGLPECSLGSECMFAESSFGRCCISQKTAAQIGLKNFWGAFNPLQFGSRFPTLQNTQSQHQPSFLNHQQAPKQQNVQSQFSNPRFQQNPTGFGANSFAGASSNPFENFGIGSGSQAASFSGTPFSGHNFAGINPNFGNGFPFNHGGGGAFPFFPQTAGDPFGSLNAGSHRGNHGGSHSGFGGPASHHVITTGSDPASARASDISFGSRAAVADSSATALGKAPANSRSDAVSLGSGPAVSRSRATGVKGGPANARSSSISLGGGPAVAESVATNLRGGPASAHSSSVSLGGGPAHASSSSQSFGGGRSSGSSASSSSSSSSSSESSSSESYEDSRSNSGGHRSAHSRTGFGRSSSGSHFGRGSGAHASSLSLGGMSGASAHSSSGRGGASSSSSSGSSSSSSSSGSFSSAGSGGAMAGSRACAGGICAGSWS